MQGELHPGSWSGLISTELPPPPSHEKGQQVFSGEAYFWREGDNYKLILQIYLCWMNVWTSAAESNKLNQVIHTLLMNLPPKIYEKEKKKNTFIFLWILLWNLLRPSFFFSPPPPRSCCWKFLSGSRMVIFVFFISFDSNVFKNDKPLKPSTFSLLTPQKCLELTF